MAETKLARAILAVYEEARRVAQLPEPAALAELEAFRADLPELGGPGGPLAAWLLDPLEAALHCAAGSERARYLACTLNMQEGATPMD